MNQKPDKELTEFTEKQRKAYKVVMKALNKKKMSRAQIYKVIKRADIYSRHRDIKETAKMLIQNPNTPIKANNDFIINELARECSNA